MNICRDFYSFLLKNKLLSFFSLFLAFGVYGIKVFNLYSGIDTLQLMGSFDFTMQHWVSIGRPGMLIFKKLLFGKYTNVYLLNFLGIFCLFLTSLFLSYLCFVTLENFFPKKKIFILPSLLITSPLWPQQYYFVLQNFEFSFCMFLVILSVVLTYNSKLISYNNIFAILFTILAFSVYQSFTIFYVSIVSFLLLLWIYKNQELNKNISFLLLLKKAASFILSFIVSALGYVAFKNFALYYYKIKPSNYLKNQILWGRFPIDTIKKSIILGFKDVVLPTKDSIAFNYLFFIGIILMLSVLLYQSFAHMTSKFSFLICALVLNISAIGIIFVYAATPPIRSLVPSYCLVCAANIFIVSLYLKQKNTQIILAIFVALYTFKQVNLTSNLLVSDQIRYEEDNQKVETINNQINSLGLENPQSYKLMLVGFWPSESSLIQSSSMIGSSIFNFGDFTGDSYATSQNVINLMRTRGVIFQFMTHDEYKKLLPNTSKMAKFPAKSSVKVIGKTIIIKLQ